ncbi:hypothetical protein LTR16_002372 [Cryomyces antarcticus]|uniref:Methyl-accepting transducer domain-containing protein n=1 Tax=Cryomyces antarcticus TaxID=329879 RepID=A0ABR0M7Z7_9PEZI|nr:hypothetical protein LTR16_002372 [Cryomyces antarcticus]
MEESSKQRLSLWKGKASQPYTAKSMLRCFSSSEVISTSTFSPVASVVSSIASTITESSKITVTSGSASATPSEASEVDVEAKVADDLRNWQEKFAKAAKKGSEDLKERVQDITDRQIKSQVHGVGQAHVAQLEETSSTAIDNVKSKITSVVKSLPTDASDEDVASAEEKLLTYIRGAGKAIKAKAQNLRSWKQSYDEETLWLVKAASNSTLEVIDNIRDLGLQEIGQRWALMEGVAYKNWSKYHNLKKTFDEWRDEVEDVATKHEGLSKAKKEGSQMEEKGMAVAEEAAKQLAKLKDVARWKAQARDTSDDFSVRRFPAAAAKAAQQVRDKMSDASTAVVGTSQGTMESVISAGSSYATGAASVVSASLVGTETGSVESAETNLSEKLVGTEQPAVESVASVAKEKVQENFSKASQSVIGTEPGVGEKAATRISKAIIGSQQHATESVASSISSMMADVSLKASRSLGPKAASLLSAAKYKKDQASASIVGTPAPLHESVPSQASSRWDSVSSAVPEALSSQETSNNLAEKASSKVWGGAMAQAVPETRQIILEEDIVDEDTFDDDVTYSERLQSIVSRIGDHASELTMAISDALAKPMSTQGSVESVTSLASEQYERAMSAASSILYGTEQGTGESISSVASERYARAVTAASYAIYGTPAAVGASLASQVTSVASSVSAPASFTSGSLAAVASSRYAEAVNLASSHYSMAKSRASVQISGTPKPVHEQMLSSIESAYSGSLSAASEKLRSALGYTATASSMLPSPSQRALESISSMASSRLAEGLSIASAQYTSAKIAVGAQPTPEPQQYMAEAQRRYYEGIGMAHERYSEFLNAASSAVYGTSTPAHQSLMNRASSSVIGTSTPAYENMLSAAQSRYNAAVAAASDNMQSVLGSASSVGAAQSVVDSASSAYDSVVSAASASFVSASSRASTAIYGSPTGSIESMASAISAQVESVVSVASSGVVGSETAWSESVAYQASQNWEALVSKASEQIYGSPTPFTASVMSQAGDYAAQATEAAASQYAAVQALFSELVVGREPDFTESVMSRLSLAYSTGFGAPAMASSASSYASDAYASASSAGSSYASEAYASASSVVSSVFTPPATLEAILSSATDQINAAVDAASIQFYGSTTEKGTFEHATSAAASAYSSVHAKASAAVYGTQTGYVEVAQSSMADVAASAQSALSVALYGTPTGAVDAVTNSAVSAYASLSAVAADNVAAASSAVYGPEQGALESAQSRVAAAVESARARMAEFAGAGAAAAAAEKIERAQSALGDVAASVSSAADGVRAGVSSAAADAASSVSSVASSVTSKIRDEL